MNGDGGGGGYKPVVQEENGEISMSFEETNKLRASLGLKPLSRETKRKDEAREEHERGMARMREQEEKAAGETIRAKLQAMSEKRRYEEQLRRVKTLGDEDEDGDDIMAWVNKSRFLEQKRQEDEKEAAREALRERARKRRREAEEGDEEEGDEGGYSSRNLAGMRAKHADELELGETAIMTLDDKGVLDEHGNLIEDDDQVLVDLARQQEKRKRHAKEIASAQLGYSGVKALEEGKAGGILPQYDVEEDFKDKSKEVVLGEDGSAARAEKEAKEEEVRAALAQKIALVEERAKASGDYMEAGEAEARIEKMKERRKKKKKKERSLRAKREEEEEGDTAALIAQLEEERAGEKVELGSRKDREELRRRREEKEKEEAQARKANFDRALEKANYASLALRPSEGAAGAAGGDDEDDELFQSLERARAAALKAGAAKESLEGVAQALVRKREEEEKKEAGEAAGKKGIVIDGAIEFVRGIDANEGHGKKEEGQEEGDEMEVDDDGAPGPSDMEGARKKGERRYRKKEGDQGVGETAKAKDKDRESMPPPPAVEATGVAEKSIGRGLGLALGALREKGELREHVQWAGRNNDMSKLAVQDVEDALFGASQLRDGNIEEIRIENALRKTDQFGRILTPKEAWRQLNYSFHGFGASRNKQEKFIKKYAEDLKTKKAAASVNLVAKAVNKEKAAKEHGGAAFSVMRGEIKPGQMREAVGKYGTRQDD